MNMNTPPPLTIMNMNSRPPLTIMSMNRRGRGLLMNMIDEFYSIQKQPWAEVARQRSVSITRGG